MITPAPALVFSKWPGWICTTNHKVVLEVKILVAEESCFRWEMSDNIITVPGTACLRFGLYGEGKLPRKQGWITGRRIRALSGPSEKQLQSLTFVGQLPGSRQDAYVNVHLILRKTMSHSVVYLPIWFQSQCKCRSFFVQEERTGVATTRRQSTHLTNLCFQRQPATWIASGNIHLLADYVLPSRTCMFWQLSHSHSWEWIKEAPLDSKRIPVIDPASSKKNVYT